MSAGKRKIGFGQIEGKKTRIIYVKREKGNLSSTDSFQEIKDSICKKRKNKFVADRQLPRNEEFYMKNQKKQVCRRQIDTEKTKILYEKPEKTSLSPTNNFQKTRYSYIKNRKRNSIPELSSFES